MDFSVLPASLFPVFFLIANWYSSFNCFTGESEDSKLIIWYVMIQKMYYIPVVTPGVDHLYTDTWSFYSSLRDTDTYNITLVQGCSLGFNNNTGRWELEELDLYSGSIIKLTVYKDWFHRHMFDSGWFLFIRFYKSLCNSFNLSMTIT